MSFRNLAAKEREYGVKEVDEVRVNHAEGLIAAQIDLKRFGPLHKSLFSFPQQELDKCILDSDGVQSMLPEYDRLNAGRNGDEKLIEELSVRHDGRIGCSWAEWMIFAKSLIYEDPAYGVTFATSLLSKVNPTRQFSVSGDIMDGSRTKSVYCTLPQGGPLESIVITVGDRDLNGHTSRFAEITAQGADQLQLYRGTQRLHETLFSLHQIFGYRFYEAVLPGKKLFFFMHSDLGYSDMDPDTKEVRARLSGVELVTREALIDKLARHFHKVDPAVLEGLLLDSVVKELGNITSLDSITESTFCACVGKVSFGDPSSGRRYVFKVEQDLHVANKELTLLGKSAQFKHLNPYIPRLEWNNLVEFEGHYLILESEQVPGRHIVDPYKEKMYRGLASTIGCSPSTLGRDHTLGRIYVVALWHTLMRQYINNPICSASPIESYWAPDKVLDLGARNNRNKGDLTKFLQSTLQFYADTSLQLAATEKIGRAHV